MNAAMIFKTIEYGTFAFTVEIKRQFVAVQRIAHFKSFSMPYMCFLVLENRLK